MGFDRLLRPDCEKAMWSTVKGTLRMMLPQKRLRCSFCGRAAEDVERLVAGAKAYICDACIGECVAVLQDNGGFEARPSRASQAGLPDQPLPTPA